MSHAHMLRIKKKFRFALPSGAWIEEDGGSLRICTRDDSFSLFPEDALAIGGKLAEAVRILKLPEARVYHRVMALKGIAHLPFEQLPKDEQEAWAKVAEDLGVTMTSGKDDDQ